MWAKREKSEHMDIKSKPLFYVGDVLMMLRGALRNDKLTKRGLEQRL